jgi:hypothetical protein
MLYPATPLWHGSIDQPSSNQGASLARPGGNITGFTGFDYSLSGKWLELLKQIAPGVTRAAVIRDPAIIRDRPVGRPLVRGPLRSSAGGHRRPYGATPADICSLATAVGQRPQLDIEIRRNAALTWGRSQTGVSSDYRPDEKADLASFANKPNLRHTLDASVSHHLLQPSARGEAFGTLWR